MSILIRKAGGVLGTAFVWGALWAAMFVILGSIVGLIQPVRGDIGLAQAAVIVGWVGLLSGGLFGVLMSVAESGKTMRGISLGRAALWGVLASAVYPLSTQRADQVFWTCPFGALVAVTLLVIGRKIETPGRSRRLVGRVVALIAVPLREAVGPVTEIQ